MHELLIQAAIDAGDIAELEQALRLEAPSIQKAACQSPPPKAATQGQALQSGQSLNQAFSCWDDFIRNM
jgi:hypothetical protein